MKYENYFKEMIVCVESPKCSSSLGCDEVQGYGRLQLKNLKNLVTSEASHVDNKIFRRSQEYSFMTFHT